MKVRFALRTLFIFFTLVALFCALFGARLYKQRSERIVLDGINSDYGLFYDHQWTIGKFNPDAQSPGPRVLRQVFGDDFFADVVGIIVREDASDDDVQHLGRLSDLRYVHLRGEGITDKCVDSLLLISRLEKLTLSDSNISPSGLKRLVASRRFSMLSMQGAWVNDEHLQVLQASSGIDKLQLVYVPVTDDGISSIARIPDLNALEIYHG